jgi:hypothetical protein
MLCCSDLSDGYKAQKLLVFKDVAGDLDRWSTYISGIFCGTLKPFQFDGKNVVVNAVT